MKNYIFLLFLAIFIVVGLTNAISPETMWRIQSRMFENPNAMKPSKFGFAMQRIVGVIFLIVVGIIIFNYFK